MLAAQAHCPKSSPRQPLPWKHGLSGVSGHAALDLCLPTHSRPNLNFKNGAYLGYYPIRNLIWQVKNTNYSRTFHHLYHHAFPTLGSISNSNLEQFDCQDQMARVSRATAGDRPTTIIISKSESSPKMSSGLESPETLVLIGPVTPSPSLDRCSVLSCPWQSAEKLKASVIPR